MLFDRIGQPVKIAFAPFDRVETGPRFVAGPLDQGIERIRRVEQAMAIRRQHLAIL